MQSWAQGIAYEELLRADPEVSHRLTPEELHDCFNPAHSFRHIDAIYERNGLK